MECLRSCPYRRRDSTVLQKGNAEGEKVADTSPLLVEAAMVKEEEVDSQRKDATVM